MQSILVQHNGKTFRRIERHQIPKSYINPVYFLNLDILKILNYISRILTDGSIEISLYINILK